MDGWNAESCRCSLAFQRIGHYWRIWHYHPKKILQEIKKVRVFACASHIGNPDILISWLSPTNGFGGDTILWVGKLPSGFQNIVIVVLSRQHFLDEVSPCGWILNFGEIQIYSGNYTLPGMSLLQAQHLSSDLIQTKIWRQAKRTSSILLGRFSANVAKSSRRPHEDDAKIEPSDEIEASSMRPSPWNCFQARAWKRRSDLYDHRKSGNWRLMVFTYFTDCQSNGGQRDKIAFISKTKQAVTISFFKQSWKKSLLHKGSLKWE